MKCRKSLLVILAVVVIGLGAVILSGCDEVGNNAQQPKSATGVTKATATIETGTDGLTTEQRNVKKRLENDNQIGAIKYLYVVSVNSGDCLYHDVIDGKVTSSNKRLTPSTVEHNFGGQYQKDTVGMKVAIGEYYYWTREVLGDDGTYSSGSGNPYLYYWSTTGIYRQIYPTAGTFVMISEEPVSFPKIIVNLAMQKPENE